MTSDLNLRTVQRIGKEGAISLQLKKSLAAAFEIDINQLNHQPPTLTTKFEYKTIVIKSDINWMSGWGKKTVKARLR